MVVNPSMWNGLGRQERTLPRMMLSLEIPSAASFTETMSRYYPSVNISSTNFTVLFFFFTFVNGMKDWREFQMKIHLVQFSMNLISSHTPIYCRLC